MTELKPFPPFPGIHALRILLPGFPDLICSNMFALGHGPVTLIDSAPKFPGSFSAMEAQLASIGFAWSDVERIIITHGHIDHFGLVGMIRDAAGHPVDCYIHEDDLWRLSRDYLQSGMWSDDADRFYVAVGMPEPLVGRMKRRSHFFKNLCDPVDDAIPVKDGHVFEGDGFSLSVIHTPGHSPGCCCLHEARSRVLFSGDHLLRHITPNPFHEVNRSRLGDASYKSLKAYTASLDRIEHLDISSVFPGHGEPFQDVKSLLKGYRSQHLQRSRTVLSALGTTPRSIYDLMTSVFPGIDESESFLAVSEVFVHLELLIEKGLAILRDEGPPQRYVSA